MKSTLNWRKSSFSTGEGSGGSCVEVAPLPDGGVAMRNSTLGDASPVVHYTQAELKAFILGVKAGEFDDLV
ncbi:MULTISPECIES: DUF397 domain-containing protein [Actinosynnema]|uniref:DUF397 domain-containing protein n=1 Tax=Actinosynnema TaxID=40566 RepID=UPI0020A5B3D7|nr:DUF397 domain-containing protein [Actinosynnema pretiosum]MCP2098266.1 protein of unknown function (DUF397) [Actinosynnema pretiosum]